MAEHFRFSEAFYVIKFCLKVTNLHWINNEKADFDVLVALKIFQLSDPKIWQVTFIFNNFFQFYLLKS